MSILNIDIPTYCEDDNPIKKAHSAMIEWTIDNRDMLQVEKMWKDKCKGVKKNKVLIKKRNSTEVTGNEVTDDKSKIIKLEVKEEVSDDKSKIVKVEVKQEVIDNVDVKQEITEN